MTTIDTGKKRVYIAGKVSGLPRNEVSAKFGMYEKVLMAQGIEPVVPLNIVDPGDDWYTAMRKCIFALCACDEIHLLHDWKESKGATLEHSIAGSLGITILYI